MYCYRCGSWKSESRCPSCGAEESRRCVPQTAEGKALRALFDMEDIGPDSTIGNPDRFKMLVTDVLPGERYVYFRTQLSSISHLYTVRRVMTEQIHSGRLPESGMYEIFCRNAEVTGYAAETCQRVIRALYEMIGWPIPEAAAEPKPPEPALKPELPSPAAGQRGKTSPVEANAAGVKSIPPFLPEAAKVGSIVTFGRYPQEGGSSELKPIEWLVLDTDEEKSLLLSRYGLDAKPYNTKYEDVTWETCTLRRWLNGEFLNTAFTPAERKNILTVTVDNSRAQGYSGWDTRGGKDTRDRVFLLSVAEANRYFGGIRLWKSDGSAVKMESRVAPTKYAVARGAWTNDTYKTPDGAPAGWWWLRSPGNYQALAAFVRLGGSLDSYAVSYEGVVVRPALWVSLDALGC